MATFGRPASDEAQVCPNIAELKNAPASGNRRPPQSPSPEPPHDQWLWIQLSRGLEYELPGVARAKNVEVTEVQRVLVVRMELDDVYRHAVTTQPFSLPILDLGRVETGSSTDEAREAALTLYMSSKRSSGGPYRF